MKNMKKFDVTITETCELIVHDIYANSLEEAEEIVRQEWRDSEHILDADNFVEVKFNAIAACTCTCESGCGV